MLASQIPVKIMEYVEGMEMVSFVNAGKAMKDRIVKVSTS